MAYMRTVINSKKSPAMNLAKRYCSSMLNHALAIDERRLIQVFLFPHILFSLIDFLSDLLCGIQLYPV